MIPFQAHICLAVIVTAAAGGTAHPFPAPDGTPLTAQQATALEAGEVFVRFADVEGARVQKAVALLIIDATPKDIYAVLSDHDQLIEFMPYCRSSKRVRQEDRNAWVKFDLDLPWPIGDRHYTLEINDSDEKFADTPIIVSRWHYVPGSGNVKDIRGSWELAPHPGGRSLVRYTLLTDIGGNVPAWAINRTMRASVPGAVNGLRDRMKEVQEEKRAAEGQHTSNGASE